MKMHMYRGSHLPLLMKAVQLTTGPILELGSGMYSTTYLHWACFPMKRRLVTYENNPDWFGFANLAIADFHEVHCIPDFSTADLSEPWSVAFVDHEPGDVRIREMSRLLHADYVVAHDTERANDRKYRWREIYPLFKYQYKWNGAWPHTSVFSNKHDLAEFRLP